MIRFLISAELGQGARSQIWRFGQAEDIWQA